MSHQHKKRENAFDYSTLKRVTKLLSGPISMEVDLQTREVLLHDDLRSQLQFEADAESIDSLINSYVHPRDAHRLMHFLDNASRGLEKPIRFNVVHPLTSKKYSFEYQYEIIYVRYACTRLKGKLLKVNGRKQAGRA